jgi:hypothetical protein
MANFDAAAAKAIFQALQSQLQALAIFQAVDRHEPENAPGNRLYASITLSGIRASGQVSGLGSVSGVITFTVRVWSWSMQRPLDDVDPEVLGAVSAVMGAFSGGFTLGGTVRNIDLMSMTAAAAWAEFEGKQFRVLEVTVPVIVNDLWTEVA